MPELTEHELETAKMYQDTFKHLTTFCAGAILLSSSVVAAFFENPKLLWVLVISLGLFLLGAAVATMGLRLTVLHLATDFGAGASNNAAAERRRRHRDSFCFFSVYATYLGISVFTIFALSNFGN